MSWFGKNSHLESVMNQMQAELDREASRMPIITSSPMTWTKCNPCMPLKHRHKINAKKYGRI